MEKVKYITEVFVENRYDTGIKVFSSTSGYSFNGLSESDLNDAYGLDKMFISIDSDEHESILVRTEDIVRIEKIKVIEKEGDENEI